MPTGDAGTLFLTYTPVEDPAVGDNVSRPHTGHPAECAGKRVMLCQVPSNPARIEAVRSGRLHSGGFSTEPTNFARKSDANAYQGCRRHVVVKRDSPIKTLADLKGKRVAQTSPSSNPGNLVPRTLFPGLGLAPDRDCKILDPGKHDQSIPGAGTGDCDAAPIASGVFKRMGATWSRRCATRC